jgi:hypothetical protein
MRQAGRDISSAFRPSHPAVPLLRLIPLRALERIGNGAT